MLKGLHGTVSIVSPLHCKYAGNTYLAFDHFTFNVSDFEVKLMFYTQGQPHLAVQGKHDFWQEQFELHFFLHPHLQSSAQLSQIALKCVQ